MLNNVGYTFDPGYWASPPVYFSPKASGWDRRSVVVDPKTLAAVRGAVSLVLATQEHELAMLAQVQAHGGTMIYNGAPVTRTWVEAVKTMGGSAAAMYFGEGTSLCVPCLVLGCSGLTCRF